LILYCTKRALILNCSKRALILNCRRGSPNRPFIGMQSTLFVCARLVKRAESRLVGLPQRKILELIVG
jgi:hypothetical protein